MPRCCLVRGAGMAVEVKAAATERAGVGVWGFPPPFQKSLFVLSERNRKNKAGGGPNPSALSPALNTSRVTL